MSLILDGTAGIANNATDLSYTGTLTGSTGVVNIGAGQIYKDASGNVGIGTSSPVSPLTVAGTSSINWIGSGSSTGTATIGTQGTGGSLFVQTPSVSASYASGLGVDGTYSGGKSVINLKALGTYSGGPYSADMAFFTATNTTLSEKMRIDSGGRVQIGTTSALYSATLTLKSAGNAYNLTSSRVGAGTGSLGHIVFETDTGAVGTIFTNGASTLYNTSSDYRLKKNIAPMVGALAKVQALKPCTYKWNADGSDGEGFIAHELAEVIPGAVTGEKDAVGEDGKPVYQGIDVSFLVATLTAAIQELKAIIDTQTTRITALEAK